MFKSLNPSMVGIKCPFDMTLKLAENNGFNGVDINIQNLYREADLKIISDSILRYFAGNILRPGCAGGLLPVRLSAEQADWDKALAELPALAQLAHKLGFRRTTIVMLPFHEKLAFDDCFSLYVARLRQAAELLNDYGLGLGVEYVSQLTRRTGFPNTFIHDLAGTLKLLHAVGKPNVGLLLDSFHWHCAGETLEAIRNLAVELIVAVHLADAPNRPLHQQIAFERELPGQGVADLRGFCNAVRSTGYDGPVTCEPFHKEFEDMPPDSVAACVSSSMDSVLNQ